MLLQKRAHQKAPNKQTHTRTTTSPHHPYDENGSDFTELLPTDFHLKTLHRCLKRPVQRTTPGDPPAGNPRDTPVLVGASVGGRRFFGFALDLAKREGKSEANGVPKI